jgi:small subunit ribosomal protein S2
MQTPDYKTLLDAGVHFGHMKKKWNPKMRPYIFMEKRGIHIIDLNRTIECLELSARAMRQLAKSGKKILFVATKRQASDIVKDAALSVGMPYVTNRWLGGMMTNFTTIRRSIKKMQNIDRMLNDGTLDNVTKKERLTAQRERDKLERDLGGIAGLNRLPHALFVVDIEHEHLAVAEAKRLGMKTFAMVDTNSDPNMVDFAVPANDDAAQSIEIVVDHLTSAIKQGLNDREKAKEQKKAEKAEG